MGRPPGFPLLPLFRSRSLVAVLEQLYLARERREWSVSDLSRATGVPYATVQREVERLDEAGLVRSHYVGRVRLVTADANHAADRPLRELITLAAGPRYHLVKAIEGLDDITAAYIFGSWAARYAGEWGEAPADIDVVAVGDVDAQELFERLRPVEEFFEVPVNATVVSQHDWNDPQSGFLRSVKSGPLIPLIEQSQDSSHGDDR